MAGSSMEAYQDTALYLKEHKFVIIRVMLITCLQRLALFSVTGLVNTPPADQHQHQLVGDGHHHQDHRGHRNGGLLLFFLLAGSLRGPGAVLHLGGIHHPLAYADFLRNQDQEAKLFPVLTL